MNWEPYLNERLISRDKGYYVIKPTAHRDSVCLGCDVCNRLYRNRDDESAALEFGCCHACAIQWAHPNRSRWKSGWRPAPEEVARSVQQRPNIIVSIHID